MFQTIIALQGDSSQAIFIGLAIVGGVLGAYLPPIGKVDRFRYVFLIAFLYLLAFACLYTLRFSSNVPLFFWGYIAIGILTGVFTAWVARARSADIFGDGSYRRGPRDRLCECRSVQVLRPQGALHRGAIPQGHAIRERSSAGPDGKTSCRAARGARPAP